MRSAAIDDLLAGVLRDEPVGWPVEGAAALERAVVDRARYHGVCGLLNERLTCLATWPEGVRAAIRREALAFAMWELRHREVLGRLITGLAHQGIQSLLFKGTALAYGLYDNPAWRQRGDTDLLVGPSDLDACRRALQRLGFRRDLDAGGAVATHAEGWTFESSDGSRHAIDLHRRLANDQVVAKLFSFDELAATSRGLPRFSAEARAVGLLHALLIACLHREKHHRSPYYVDGVSYFSGDRLIWLYDMHLLAQTFLADDWRAFVSLAKEQGAAGVVLGALQTTQARFATPIDREVLAALAAAPRSEPLNRYFRASPSRQLVYNLLAVDNTVDRLRYVREILFPPRVYMHAKYQAARITWLPWLYARRTIEGLAKQLWRMR